MRQVDTSETVRKGINKIKIKKNPITNDNNEIKN